MPVEFSFATFWPLLAKAQATALEGELKVRGLHIKHMKASEVRARLACQRSQNHYVKALERGTGSVNARIGLEDRLQAILYKVSSSHRRMPNRSWPVWEKLDYPCFKEL